MLPVVEAAIEEIRLRWLMGNVELLSGAAKSFAAAESDADRYVRGACQTAEKSEVVERFAALLRAKGHASLPQASDAA